MAKAYKRKLYKECDYTDKERRQDIRKSLNSSERQRGRSIAVSELNEYESMFSEETLSALRWNLEMKLSNDCYNKEVNSPEYNLALTFERFGLPWVNPHKCTCPLPENLSDEEVLKLSGLL